MDNESFLPDDYLEHRVIRRTNLICLTLFVIITTGVVGAFLVTNQQWADVRNQQQQVDADFQKAAAQLEQLDQLQRRKDQMLRKAKVTAVLVERVPRSNILAELINNMPPMVRLMELELSTKVDKRKQIRSRTSLENAKRKVARKSKTSKANQNDSFSIAPTKVMITLTGTASTDVDVAKYMSSLGRSPLFEDVNLLFTEQLSVAGSALRKFRVEILLNQDLPLGEFEPKLVRRGIGDNPATDTSGAPGALKLLGNLSGSAVPASHRRSTAKQGD